MKRLAMALTLGLGVSMASASGGGASAQQDFDSVEIEVVAVRDGISMLVGRGGNIGLSVGEDGAFIVDDQFAPLTDKILAAIRTVTSEPVRFVVNTHFHGDHTGGNENLGGKGSIIVAHRNVRERMSTEQVRSILGDSRTPPSPDGALPKITFTEEVTFHWNGETIRAFHVPHAHTDGDAIIHFAEADVVHMGDTFFNLRYPFIDVDSGGNVNGIIAAADRVLDMARSSTRIIPGHGPLAGPDDLRAYRDMLAGVRDKVRTLVGEGKSLEEVQAAKPTSAYDVKWEGNSERFVHAIYVNVSQ